MVLRSLVICHSPADEKPVAELADYLTTNLSVEISFDTELPLLAAVDRALSAPFALALFSPDSLPKALGRTEWELTFLRAPGEFGCHLGFGLLSTCKFPELLRRERFFDFTTGFLEPARLIKQWLMRPLAMPRRVFGYADLRADLVDRPGTSHGMDSDNTFFKDVVPEFEQVCRINGLGRTPAGILGETGHQLGLVLPENVSANRQILVAHAAAHRIFLICDNLPPEHRSLVEFGGLATVVTTEGRSPATAAPVPLDLRDGWDLCRSLAAQQRHAEKIEVLEWMEGIARAKEDATALRSIKHELFFMRDDANSPDDGILIAPTADPNAGQLSLF